MKICISIYNSKCALTWTLILQSEECMFHNDFLCSQQANELNMHFRGYYRCSSSKGCSARKQVERSHSDPNMLVITYASEHNHPWPVHRNSLAGSTRSQPSKSSHNTSKNSNASHAQLSPSCSKQEPDDMSLSSSPTLELANKEKSLELARVFDHSYEPIMLETKDMGFFDELGGLEPDPMSFFFSSRVEGANKGLDPLSYFDWDGN